MLCREIGIVDLREGDDTADSASEVTGLPRQVTLANIHIHIDASYATPVVIPLLPLRMNLGDTIIRLLISWML